jgi:hypothetical protein
MLILQNIINMKKLSAIFILFLLTGIALYAQVGISADNSTPESSAMLDVKSTSKGVLLPRMTMAQILAIPNPSDGLTAFCTSDSKYYVFNSLSARWKAVSSGASALGQPFPCGIAFTVNHIAGVVAPCNKTVTYATRNGIPGEPLKCWITSNLGAARQATSETDTAEAAAGWYWQFNRKQGYKYSGTVRTPNTPWISSIGENSDWVAANDPCSLELGNPWRIPTASELTNLYNGVGYPGTWSWLNIHAAGRLEYNSGVLIDRGIDSDYWSSSQEMLNQSFARFLKPWASPGMFYTFKSYGFSIRCLRD